jgi:flagellar motor switch protein FliM
MITGVEYSPQFAQVAGVSDVMVVATLELKINDRPFRMTVCLPFAGLLPHLVRAAAPVPVSERERSQRARASAELLLQFQKVPVDVAVRIRPTTLAPDALAALAPGDVIRLDHPADAPLDVVVDGTTFAHATAGARGPRLAALIVGTPKETP